MDLTQARSRAVNSAMQAREEARIMRLTNARQRTIGLDVPALRAQERDRAEQRRAEKEEAEVDAFAARAQLQAVDEIALAAAAEEKAKKLILKETWEGQLDRRQRTTWDLEDPRALARQALPRPAEPAWVTGPGHVSSAQILYAAECKENPAVLRAKKESQRLALLQGQAEKEVVRRAEREQERATEWARATVASAIADLDTLAEGERKAKNLAIADDNRVLLDAKHLQHERARAADESDAARAKAHALADSMLLQDARTGYWPGDPTRKRPDAYRGLVGAEARAVRKVQEEDILRRAYDREEERRRREAEGRAALTLEKAALEIASAEAAEKAARQRLYYEELRAQAELARARKAAERDAARRPQTPAGSGILSGFGVSLR